MKKYFLTILIVALAPTVSYAWSDCLKPDRPYSRYVDICIENGGSRKECGAKWHQLQRNYRADLRDYRDCVVAEKRARTNRYRYYFALD